MFSLKALNSSTTPEFTYPYPLFHDFEKFNAENEVDIASICNIWNQLPQETYPTPKNELILLPLHHCPPAITIVSESSDDEMSNTSQSDLSSENGYTLDSLTEDGDLTPPPSPEAKPLFSPPGMGMGKGKGKSRFSPQPVKSQKKRKLAEAREYKAKPKKKPLNCAGEKSPGRRQRTSKLPRQLGGPYDIAPGVRLVELEVLHQALKAKDASKKMKEMNYRPTKVRRFRLFVEEYSAMDFYWCEGDVLLHSSCLEALGFVTLQSNVPRFLRIFHEDRFAANESYHALKVISPKDLGGAQWTLLLTRQGVLELLEIAQMNFTHLVDILTNAILPSMAAVEHSCTQQQNP